MKKNVASSSTPNSKKKLTIDFQQDQFQQQPQTSQFISIEDQSPSDQLKNDESIISNDLTQACSTHLILQENQDDKENQMEFINNDDDVKINADSNLLNSSDTEKFNLINNQIGNNLPNEISQSETIILQNQNPDQYQNLQQEKSHYFNPIENQDKIQQIKKERYQSSNKKKLTIDLNDDEIDNKKQEIEQGQLINSELSLKMHHKQINDLVLQQDIEGSLEDNNKQKLIHLEDNIENDNKMQAQMVEENRQDIEVENRQIVEENNCSLLIEEDTNKIITQTNSDKLQQIDQRFLEQKPDLNQEIKLDHQKLEQVQSNQIQIKDQEYNCEELYQNNIREKNFEHEKNEQQDQVQRKHHLDLLIIGQKTDFIRCFLVDKIFGFSLEFWLELFI